MDFAPDGSSAATLLDAAGVVVLPAADADTAALLAAAGVIALPAADAGVAAFGVAAFAAVGGVVAFAASTHTGGGDANQAGIC